MLVAIRCDMKQSFTWSSRGSAAAMECLAVRTVARLKTVASVSPNISKALSMLGRSLIGPCSIRTQVQNISIIDNTPNSHRDLVEATSCYLRIRNSEDLALSARHCCSISDREALHLRRICVRCTSSHDGVRMFELLVLICQH